MTIFSFEKTLNSVLETAKVRWNFEFFLKSNLSRFMLNLDEISDFYNDNQSSYNPTPTQTHRRGHMRVPIFSGR